VLFSVERGGAWSTPQPIYVDRGARRAAQVVFVSPTRAIDAGGQLLTVRNSSAGRGILGPLIPERFALAPDLKVEAIYLSDPHARPGELVDVIALLRNCGLSHLPAQFDEFPLPNADRNTASGAGTRTPTGASTSPTA